MHGRVRCLARLLTNARPLITAVMVPSICFELSNIPQGFLHLLREHSLNRRIYQKVLLSSDLKSKFLAFNTQTYCPMPTL